MKKIIDNDHVNKLDDFKIKIVGIISVISTSKIKNKIVIRKNRMEKGKREDE